MEFEEWWRENKPPIGVRVTKTLMQKEWNFLKAQMQVEIDAIKAQRDKAWTVNDAKESIEEAMDKLKIMTESLLRS